MACVMDTSPQILGGHIMTVFIQACVRQTRACDAFVRVILYGIVYDKIAA